MISAPPIADGHRGLQRAHSGNSIANGGVVSRSPTLSLITRKFARQSHAGFYESRNAVFYRLPRAVRLGSIPIARSTLRLRQTTQDKLDTVLLYQRGEAPLAVVYVLASVGVSVAALVAGMAIMRTV
jgi:hypothetical protein